MWPFSESISSSKLGIARSLRAMTVQIAFAFPPSPGNSEFRLPLLLFDRPTEGTERRGEQLTHSPSYMQRVFHKGRSENSNVELISNNKKTGYAQHNTWVWCFILMGTDLLSRVSDLGLTTFSKKFEGHKELARFCTDHPLISHFATIKLLSLGNSLLHSTPPPSSY